MALAKKAKTFQDFLTIEENKATTDRGLVPAVENATIAMLNNTEFEANQLQNNLVLDENLGHTFGEELEVISFSEPKEE